MAKYRVLEKSFIDNHLVEEGEIIEYEGEASGNLELVDQKEVVTDIALKGKVPGIK